MSGRQFSLTSLLLLLAALPLWLAMIVLLPMSHGYYGYGLSRFAIPPLVLAGVTWALHRLFRNWRNSWAISALLAAIICSGILSFVAWISG